MVKIARICILSVLTAAWNERLSNVAGTYIVHDCRPSLHRDALKDGQHREAEVIEVSDAAVWPNPVDITDPASLRRALEALATRPWHLHRDHVYNQQPLNSFPLQRIGVQHSPVLSDNIRRRTQQKTDFDCHSNLINYISDTLSRVQKLLHWHDANRRVFTRKSTACLITSGQSNVTKRPHCRRTWTVQSYSPGCANVHLHVTHAYLGSPESTTKTASRSVQPFLQGSRLWQTNRQTDRPTDRHATWSVTVGRIYVRSTAMRPNNIKAKFHYASWFEAGLKLVSDQLRTR